MTTNPGGPIIISLTQFVENSITSIYTANSESAFNSAFEDFLAKDAKITVNGKHLTVAQYKARLQSERLYEFSASVSFAGGVEVPTNAKEPLKAGSVGIFYKATVNVKDVESPHIFTSSLNVTVVDAGTSHGTEIRKVSTLDQVVAETIGLGN